jgi:hypothetical protein
MDIYRDLIMNGYIKKILTPKLINGIPFKFPYFGLAGVLTACLFLFASSNAMAVDAGNSTKQMRTLDAKVQALKKEVKSLNRDLFILEEELLFPSSTQLAVFVSVDVGNFFRLDSVQLKIDNKVVANHLYTRRELGALERGGVQRLYIGNVKSGEHELIAIFIGPGPNNREYRRGTTLKFNKSSAAKFIELKIIDSSGKLQPEFVVKEWE